MGTSSSSAIVYDLQRHGCARPPSYIPLSSDHSQVPQLTHAVTHKVPGPPPPVLRRHASEYALLPAPRLHGNGALQWRAGREPTDGGADGGVRRGARVLLRVWARLGPPTDRVQARRGMAQECARGRGHVAVDQGEHADVSELQEQHREGGRVQVRDAPLSYCRVAVG